MLALLSAVRGGVAGQISDQFLDFFYQDAMPMNVLVTKGQRRLDSNRPAPNRGNENIISNGSVVAVADGQCMCIVDQGRIMDVCAEPGEYTWTQSAEPSIFHGSLGSNIVNSVKTMARRVTFGGATARDQRVYYFNVREIKDNKFGTQQPVPFRVVDRNIGLDIDITLRANGVYSFKMVDPVLFYSNVTGNVETQYTVDTLQEQLRSEFLSSLQPAFAKLSELGLRYSAIPGHTLELCNALNECLSSKWGELRGLTVVSVGINSLSAPREDEEMIRNLQRAAALRDPGMAGAVLAGAQADAMVGAANNQGGMGAMGAFMGMNMAQQAGGANAGQLLQAGQQAQAAPAPAPAAPAPAAAGAAGWTCACGVVNTGRFCQGCGTQQPQPQQAANWTCECGLANTGRFCQDCGKPQPAAGWTCACGAENTGRFCQDCGKKRAD